MLDIKSTVPLKGYDGKSRNPLLEVIAAFAIYSMIIPLVIIDISAIIYQAIYFSIYDIPKIDRSEYIRIEKHKLGKLNVMQKIACIYCEYANGVVAWTKAVTNQTEVYSCAIKHNGHVLGQEHRAEFFPYENYQ